jgi:CheY-like chemotaxis protein
MSIARVLVADDNPLSLRFFCSALATLEIECIEATDGTMALGLSDRDAFDLLLLDARMPGLGGIEVLTGIRAHGGPSQNATALATTANDDPAAHAALREAGFVDVLVKPLGVTALRAALDRYLPVAGSRTLSKREELWLDEDQALAAAGGDRAIVLALRGLLVRELELLPAELTLISERRDANALRERLHRLDASAGFCGVRQLARAGAMLRTALDAPTWPEESVARFLDTCDRARAQLAT